MAIDDPNKYRKIPREVEALRIIDYVSMRKAVAWVTANGGSARIEFSLEVGEPNRLFVETSLGEVEIPQNYYLIKGDLGGFYSYPSEIFIEEYEEVPV